MQGMHRGGGFGERSGRAEADVEGLKQMVEDMMGKVTRLRFEDKGE